jgi:hypothetical protein
MGRETAKGIDMDPVSSIFVEGGGTIEVYATEENGSVKFTVKLADGWNQDYNLDLNGLFLDYKAGGSNKETVDGEKANNLNGATYDGEKIYWDIAVSSGSTVGGSDGQTSLMEFCVTIDGLTLAELDGALIGLRATSTGTDGEGSLKLVGKIEIPDDEEEEDDNFPDNPAHDISNIVLYFSTELNNTAQGDVNPGNGDGYYTIKIDNFSDALVPADNNLDAWLDSLVEWLVDNDPYVYANTELLGVAIKGGQDINFYALDGTPEPNAPPQGADILDFTGQNVDQVYEYVDIYA